jgi:CHASE2 domain-containing sensor protein
MDSFHNLFRLVRGRPGLGWILVMAFMGIALVSFEPLALFSYDTSFVLSKPATSITNVALVYFNDETLSELGGWHGELDRTNHARLLDYLAKDGPGSCFTTSFLPNPTPFRRKTRFWHTRSKTMVL